MTTAQQQQRHSNFLLGSTFTSTTITTNNNNNNSNVAVVVRRCYHGTSTTLLSVRRRRTNTRDGIRAKAPAVGDDDDNDDEKARVRSRDEFLPAAVAFLDKLHAALQPLLPINENMIVTRGIEKPEDDDNKYGRDGEKDDSIVYGPFLLIDLGPTDGQYSLAVDTEQNV